MSLEYTRSNISPYESYNDGYDLWVGENLDDIVELYNNCIPSHLNVSLEDFVYLSFICTERLDHRISTVKVKR